MKKFTMIAVLLCASLLSFAIDWSGYQWLGDGAGGGVYSNKYKVAPAEGQSVINIQQPGWASEPGIYTCDFGGAITSCSLGDKCAIDGGGIVLYLSAFTQQETEVTVVAALGSKTFTVYYADGTTGGGSGESSDDTEEVYDTNLALVSNGATASAKSGSAAAANDGNMGTRWSSDTDGLTEEQKNDQWWQVDLGQRRIFNTIQIEWEGAWGKSFDIQISDDAETWTTVKQIRDQNIPGPFPYLQTIELDANKTARYVRFQGVARGTQWAYSFWEFRVLLPGTSEVTTVSMNQIVKLNAEAAITVKDQNGNVMTDGITYTVAPASAGSVTDGKYKALVYGKATVTASKDGHSASITVYNVETDNLALNQTATAGASQNTTNLANNGNAGDRWGSNGATHYATDPENFGDWWYVDLGAKYDVLALNIKWETARPNDYDIRISDDATNWTTIGTYNEYPAANEYTVYADLVPVGGRYVGVWARQGFENLAYGISIYEFEAYGREYAGSADTEKPVMGAASLASKTWNTAVINVAATDNNAVASFHVVDAGHGIDKKFIAADGKITVNGLTQATAYTFTITAVDVAANESDNSATVNVTTDDHLFAPTAAATAPTWPAAQVAAIYSPTYNADCGFGEWGSGTVVSDDTYGKKYVLAGGGYFGMTDFNLNCINMEKLHYDIWVADDCSIRVVPIWGGTEYGVTVNLVGQQWNSIDIEKSAYPGITDWSNIYQVKIDNAANLTLWIANAYFYRETAIQDEELPTAVTASVTTSSYYHVWIAASATDNSGSVSFVVKNGDQEVAAGAGASGATVNIKVSSLTPNTAYTFSVIAKDDAGNEAEAVTVQATTAAAPAPAPKPDFTDKTAVAVFCDELEGNPAITIGNWGQSTIIYNVELAEGDHAMFGANFNYLGWEFTPDVDATEMEYLHVDFFTPNVTNVSLTPISRGHEGAYTAQLTANQWNSVDVALSTFEAANIDWSKIFQFKFMDATPVGGELFIDNVYFYKPTTSTGVENALSEGAESKYIENGTLYIVRDGKTYTIQGVRVR